MRDVMLKFKDGKQAVFPAHLAYQIAGYSIDSKTGESFLVAMGEDFNYGLTNCCYASGKGASVPSGVVCRSCYQEVSGIFGMVVEIDAEDTVPVIKSDR